MEQIDFNTIATRMVSGISYATSIPSGYTYLGQMIAHDIVPTTNKFASTRDVTPVLNLDSIYGDFPSYLYQFSPDNIPFLNADGTFKIQQTLNPQTNQLVYDFFRVTQQQKHIAMIPESRNDENIIVAQMHLLWQRLHNKLLHTGIAENAWQAKQWVTLLFQMVVQNEFAKAFLEPKVYDAYFKQGKAFFPNWDHQSIPGFFRFGAFRFGHSAVRPSYKLNAAHNGSRLVQLIQKARPFKPEQQIDWQLFFSPDTDVRAMQIDTNISFGMTQVNSANPNQEDINVVKRNLQAGFNHDLPSGIHFCQELIAHNSASTLKDLGFRQLTNEDLHASSIGEVKGLAVEALPLWLYVLLEASCQHDGDKLGTLGSILVSEVLMNTMHQSQISIYQKPAIYAEKAMQRLDKIKHVIDVDSSESIMLQIHKFVS